METVDKNPPSVLSDPQEGEHPAINFLWVILDGSKLTDGQKKKIGRRYKAFSLKPSHIFDSNGSRCVLLWSLKKTTPEDIPKSVIENLLKRLASHFYGDPGIPDLPQDLPEWKIAESHPERKYYIEDFDSCIPQIEGIQGEELPDEVSENHIETELGASPQAEDGHVDIANEIVEALAKIKLSSYESRVLWALFRKTYGWHKKTDRISITQFQEITRMDRRNVHRTLSKLVQKKIVVRLDNSRIITYGFQKDYTKWRDIVQIDNDAGIPRVSGQGQKKIVARLDNRSLSKQTPTKETNKEKTYVEDSDPLRLSAFLLEEIRRNKADFKGPSDLQMWARVFDLMVRHDHRSPEAIERVIKWAQADHGDGTGRWKGWASNILSPGRLREKFDELEMKMQGKPKPQERGPKYEKVN